MLHYGKLHTQYYQNQVHINKMQWRPPAVRAVNTYLAVIGSLKYLRKKDALLKSTTAQRKLPAER